MVNRLEQNRIWRANNPEKLKIYNKQDYLKRKAQRRIERFGDRKCPLCSIPLAHPTHGAKRTVRFCYGCSQDRQAKNRYWYELKKQRLNATITQ